MTVNNERSDVNSVEFYRDQVARIVPATGKIADLTHADTNEHAMALPAGYPANTKAIYIKAVRIAGTGNFNMLSVTGGTVAGLISGAGTYLGLWFRSAAGTWLYSLTVANDDWDIYAMGRIEA